MLSAIALTQHEPGPASNPRVTEKENLRETKLNEAAEIEAKYIRALETLTEDPGLEPTTPSRQLQSL